MGVPAWSQATITAVPSYDTVLRLRMDAIKFGCSAVYRYRRLGHSPIEVSATGESGRACKSLLSTVCVRGELTVAHRRDALALVVALASDRAGFVLRATRRWTLRMDRRTDAVARATRLALTGSGHGRRATAQTLCPPRIVETHSPLRVERNYGYSSSSLYSRGSKCAMPLWQSMQVLPSAWALR